MTLLPNLLLRVFQECLIMPINNNINLAGNFDAQSVEINFYEILMFICMRKINFIFDFFFEIL